MINLESDREEIKPLDLYQILFVLCFDIFGHAASLNMSDNHHSWLMDYDARSRSADTNIMQSTRILKHFYDRKLHKKFLT